MNYIVYDLEATCWETEQEKRGRKQEIIEIGALKIDEEGETVSKFEAFVRPVAHPMLSDFCKNLTTISQIDVNKARPYPEVIEDFLDWIGYTDGEEYLLCSWGFFDRKMLIKNSEQHGMNGEWAKAHISLKHQYPRIKGIRMAIGLKRALDREGFEFEGEQHRGIDDAINLAKIFKKYQTQWRY